MRSPLVAGMSLLLLLAACDPGGFIGDGEGDTGEPDDLQDQVSGLPSQDRPDTVDVGSWNVEWFGDGTNGPTDELQQQANVTRVLAQLDLDLVGLVEVVSEDAFDTLLDELPGYGGLLVTDDRVAGGSDYYGEDEQKVALLFHERFTVESARVVLTDSSWDFGGRPPMEVTLAWTEGGRARELVVIVAHFKAMASYDGYQRRVASAVALKEFLDAEYPTRWVLVVGDLNDDIDTSTYHGETSPFAPLVDDPGYRFTTDRLTAAGTSTTVHFASTIDHHLATDDLVERFVEDSAQVLRVDADVDDYATTTSDHYPVLTRYDLR